MEISKIKSMSWKLCKKETHTILWDGVVKPSLFFQTNKVGMKFTVRLVVCYKW